MQIKYNEMILMLESLHTSYYDTTYKINIIFDKFKWLNIKQH